jgi:DNA-directed RNA polymerase subunit L
MGILNSITLKISLGQTHTLPSLLREELRINSDILIISIKIPASAGMTKILFSN